MTAIAIFSIKPDADPRHDITLVVAGLTVVFYYLVLLVTDYRERFAQSLTAIFGTDVLLTALLLVIYLVLGAVTDDLTAGLMIFILSYWSVAVQGNIIAKAIQQHFGMGLAIAIAARLLMEYAVFQLSDAA